MARTDSARVRMARWKRQLDASEKIYKDWEKDYSADKLEAFVVKSRQWVDTAKKLDPYLCNLLLPSLDARMPALLFDTPHAIVTPQSAKTDDIIPPPQPLPQDPVSQALGLPPEMAPPAPETTSVTPQGKAKLRQDLLNTIIQSRASNFSSETNLALREAFFRFGMVECYYTAEIQDFKDMAAEYDSPLSIEPGEPATPDIESASTPPGPQLNSSGMEQSGPPAKPLKPATPEELDKPAPLTSAPEDQQALTPEASIKTDLPKRIPKPGTEKIKFRRIPARTIRVSSNAKNDLERCDWVAYYEWKYVDDIKANPTYKNRSGLKAKYSNIEQVLGTQEGDGHKNEAPADGMVKLWKLWSIRESKQFVWVDGEENFLVDGKPYITLPLAGLKFVEVLDEWYPVPVSFNWTGAQIEYNETRDAQRTHRRRALRKFIYHEGIDDEELAKLASPEDMEFAKIPINLTLADAIQPVAAAPMDPISDKQIVLSRSDVYETTRVGGEQRQVASSNTARQASIIAVSKQVQDSRDRNIVSDWLVNLCWKALKIAEQNITFGFLVKTTVDASGPGAQLEEQKLSETWRVIQMDDLGSDLEYEIKIDIESLAPMNSTLMSQQWTALLQLLSNPAVLTIFSRSEAIARKILSGMGIRDEADVQEVIGVARQMVPPPGAAPMAPGTPGAPTPAAPDTGATDGGAGENETLGALGGLLASGGGEGLI